MSITRWMTAFAVAFALICTPGIAHAARFWVSNELGDVAEADAASVSAPQPVQLIFQFKTNGAANARATNYLKDQITQLVTESGFFSEVSASPVASGAIVSVTIDNIPQADAASRGFATGLTFGLAGTTVADFYEASVEYVPSASGATVRKEARHTLFTTIGRTEPPANTTQAQNAEQGIRTLTRQLVTHMLNDLARDPAFSGVAAPTPPPEAVATPVADAAPAPPAETAAPAPAPTN